MGQISGRVLLRLLELPALTYGSAASLQRTQAGLCAHLDIRQGSLTRALARLEASGALTSQRRHVEGMSQRLKVYELTTLGESVARTLRRRAAAAQAPGEFRAGPRGPVGPEAGGPVRPSRRGSGDRPDPQVEYIR